MDAATNEAHFTLKNIGVRPYVTKSANLEDKSTGSIVFLGKIEVQPDEEKHIVQKMGTSGDEVVVLHIAVYNEDYNAGGE